MARTTPLMLVVRRSSGPLRRWRYALTAYERIPGLLIDFAKKLSETINRNPFPKTSMSYVKISPEVAGSLGEGTRMDTSRHPPTVTHVHHQFEGWLGDDLLEVFPCFFATARLANALKLASVTGFTLAPAEVSASEEFEETRSDTRAELPNLEWLQITAAFPAEADFRLAADHRLEVSERVLALLRTFRIDHAVIE